MKRLHGSGVLLATAIAALTWVRPAPGSGEDNLASTTACEILVTARLESEVIDATDKGSYLLWKWRDHNGLLDLVSFWKNGVLEKVVPRIDGYTNTQRFQLVQNSDVRIHVFHQDTFGNLEFETTRVQS